MSITCFGSCRIDSINNNNNLNNLITFTHSTKEVIQLIEFLLGHINITSPYDIYCFRSGIIYNKPILLKNNFIELFKKSTLCIIEICSIRTYIENNYYLHHLAVDKRYPEHRNTSSTILHNYKCIIQTDDEIEKDILKIQQLISPRKLLLVTHYNSKLNNSYLSSRDHLIYILTTIANKYNIPLINPTIALKDYDQNMVMSNDLGHYTSFGKNKMVEYINKFIELNNLNEL